MRYKLVIFDMDGTLLDTLSDLHDSVNYCLESAGYPTHTIRETKSFVGNGMKKLIERALPKTCSASEVDEMYSLLFDYYKEHAAIKTKAYDGIIELLKDLRAAGIKTAVVSNKPNDAVQTLTEKYFKNLFDISYGEVSGYNRKPAPDLIHLVLEKLEINEKDAVYVGDSEVDILTAKNANMPCISVTWGFRDKEFLIEKGAYCLVDTPDEIKKISFSSGAFCLVDTPDEIKKILFSSGANCLVDTTNEINNISFSVE